MVQNRIPVLFIASRSDIAGGENYLLSVMRHLDQKRYEPLVVLPGQGEFQTALNGLGIETIVVDSPYGFLRPAAPWYRLVKGLDERVGRIAEIIRARNVEIVHTNSNMRLEGALAARLLGIHHLYLAHIEFQPNMPIFERFPISQASFAQLMGDLSTRVVAVSQSVAAALIPPIAPDKVRVIHNGLELEKFDSALAFANGSLRHELGLSDDAVLVASIGRIHPDKGNDFLIQAAFQVTRQAKNVHFVHAGGDDDQVFADKLRSDVKSLALTEQFHFLGFRQDVARILAESDIFVLSSRREGHPFVLLEAMASGCASVATRCGGVEDTVVDGNTGLLVEIGDADGMTQAVMKLASDANLRVAMAASARADVCARFDAKASVAALMRVYEEVLGSPKDMPGSPAIDLFLRATHEIGALGLQVSEIDERLRQVEHLAAKLRENRLYRAVHEIKLWWKGVHRSVNRELANK